jgi:long-chain acyl-CoA synthetase
MNLAHHLIRSAALRGGAFNALDDASARVVGLLRAQGIEPAERVAIMLPDGSEFAITYYGALRAGCVVVPMNVLLTEREVAFCLADSQARMVFAWHECASAAGPGATAAGSTCMIVDPASFAGVLAGIEPVAEVAARNDGDTAVIVYGAGALEGTEFTHSDELPKGLVCA